MQLGITDPPLFVVTKQIEVEMDNFFYKVLEQRGNIKNEVIGYLIQKYSEMEWVKDILKKIEEDEIHMFMPFSH